MIYNGKFAGKKIQYPHLFLYNRKQMASVKWAPLYLLSALLDEKWGTQLCFCNNKN